MFWITLGLALSIFMVALAVRKQAQRADERFENLETRQGLNFDWLKAQLPHKRNLRPTIVMDYKNQPDEIASAAGANWSDDALKTQVLDEQSDSGFRRRQSWIAKP